MDHPRRSLKFVPLKDLDQSKISFEGFTVEDPAEEKLGKIEGFILDIERALPYYTVVDAGGWFRSKHILIPIGHFALDTESKRLVADVPKDRVKRFPGFELDLFPKLTQEDLNQMADEISRVCCPDLLVEPVEVLSIEVSTHYRTPAWWDASFYTGQQPTDEQEQQSANRPR
jgi:PRC-barrel domain protein